MANDRFVWILEGVLINFLFWDSVLFGILGAIKFIEWWRG